MNYDIKLLVHIIKSQSLKTLRYICIILVSIHKINCGRP